MTFGIWTPDVALKTPVKAKNKPLWSAYIITAVHHHPHVSPEGVEIVSQNGTLSDMSTHGPNMHINKHKPTSSYISPALSVLFFVLFVLAFDRDKPTKNDTTSITLKPSKTDLRPGEVDKSWYGSAAWSSPDGECPGPPRALNAAHQPSGIEPPAGGTSWGTALAKQKHMCEWFPRTL